ncbi:hypothetical protein N9C08_01535 [Rubripirellula sp.]|nr:hypothetical protein [Rubripirellula sp.]
MTSVILKQARTLDEGRWTAIRQGNATGQMVNWLQTFANYPIQFPASLPQ